MFYIGPPIDVSGSVIMKLIIPSVRLFENTDKYRPIPTNFEFLIMKMAKFREMLF
jgi:hypothetical protein